jgi:hypothetical protein
MYFITIIALRNYSVIFILHLIKLIVIINISLNSEILKACNKLQERFFNITFSFIYFYVVELFIKVFLFVASYKVTFKSFNYLLYYIVFISSS